MLVDERSRVVYLCLPEDQFRRVSTLIEDLGDVLVADDVGFVAGSSRDHQPFFVDKV